MITYPNAKINLGLNIVEKRPDGYHNIETVFYPIPLHDTLSVEPLAGKNNATDMEFRFQVNGRQIDCPPEKNLVIKAYRMLQNITNLPAIDILMQKDIPFGAGLGGGSSDAAFMLKALNREFSLNLTTDELEKTASHLGADCAFFIKNRPTLAEGIGNIFTPVNISLKGLTLVLIKPDIYISTQEAYAHVCPQKPKYNLAEAILKPVSTWKDTIRNDFEDSLFPNHPELMRIKEELYRQGALYASMSGSGSSIYGIFQHEPPQEMADTFKPHFYWTSILNI